MTAASIEVLPRGELPWPCADQVWVSESHASPCKKAHGMSERRTSTLSTPALVLVTFTFHMRNRIPQCDGNARFFWGGALGCGTSRGAGMWYLKRTTPAQNREAVPRCAPHSRQPGEDADTVARSTPNPPTFIPFPPPNTRRRLLRRLCNLDKCDAWSCCVVLALCRRCFSCACRVGGI